MSSLLQPAKKTSKRWPRKRHARFSCLVLSQETTSEMSWRLLPKTHYFDCQRFFSRTIPFSNTCEFSGWTGGNRCGISAGKGFFVKISNFQRWILAILTNPGLAAVCLARHRNGNSVEQRFWRLKFWSLLIYFWNVCGGFSHFSQSFQLLMPFFWCFLNSMQSSFLLRWPRKAESEFQNHLQCQGDWGLILQKSLWRHYFPASYIPKWYFCM